VERELGIESACVMAGSERKRKTKFAAKREEAGRNAAVYCSILNTLKSQFHVGHAG